MDYVHNYYEICGQDHLNRVQYFKLNKQKIDVL